ncbi:MAG: S66 peptidase family protein [Mycobacterium leprae]
MRKAPRLKPGDRIGILAPAGPVESEVLARGVDRLCGWGFQPVLGGAVLGEYGYLAATDAERAADFNALWSDPTIAGIICARGGYGSMRILEQIDWELVAEQPKFFCGFSDVTALHLAMNRRTQLVTFHGPMAAAFGDGEAYNGVRLLAAMTTGGPLGRIPWPALNEVSPYPVVIRPGSAEGRLIGGNLTTLCALMGTPWEPEFDGRILLLEEVGEPLYRVDRMLTQLLLSGKLRRVSGILFGDSPEPGPPGPSLMPELLRELLGPLEVPVLYGFPCGHTAYRATLPLGVMARLDVANADLTMLEGALTW